MNEIEIKERILALIKEKIEDEEIVIQGNMNLFGDLEFDSIKIIELILEIENEYNFQFEEYDKLVDVVESIDEFIGYFTTIIKGR